MSQKRNPDDDASASSGKFLGNHSPDDKRRRSIPSFRSVVLEVMRHKYVQHELERMLRRVKMQTEDILSPIDVQRLDEFGIVLESAEGGLLTEVNEERLNLVKPTTDGSIPRQSMIQVKRRSEFVSTYTKHKVEQYLEEYRSVKVSPALSDFLWPFGKGNDQIELWSTVPYFPPPGKLTIVGSSNGERKEGVGKYCLAACEDGTVKWLHKSECENKTNHVWKVNWFDLRGGGVVYFGDRLERPLRNVCINVVNKYIGGNINVSGTQNIATVNCG